MNTTATRPRAAKPRPGKRPPATTPPGRLPILIADHDHAAAAATMPDVAHELRVHAQRTATALGLNPDNPTVLGPLLDYGRGSYIHGHMDATADHNPAPITPLARALDQRAAA